MPGYDLDNDNPLWVKGWGVYRMSPWHLLGIFPTKEEAERERAAVGQEYAVDFGSRQLGTNNFIVSRAG
jgi:hypothetical protein